MPGSVVGASWGPAPDQPHAGEWCKSKPLLQFWQTLLRVNRGDWQFLFGGRCGIAGGGSHVWIGFLGEDAFATYIGRRIVLLHDGLGRGPTTIWIPQAVFIISFGARSGSCQNYHTYPMRMTRSWISRHSCLWFLCVSSRCNRNLLLIDLVLRLIKCGDGSGSEAMLRGVRPPTRGAGGSFFCFVQSMPVEQCELMFCLAAM